MQFYRKQGFYERWIKRLLDVICSLGAVIVFGWLYVVIALAVRWKMGSPVIFKQARPGRMDPRQGKDILSVQVPDHDRGKR